MRRLIEGGAYSSKYGNFYGLHSFTPSKWFQSIVEKIEKSIKAIYIEIEW